MMPLDGDESQRALRVLNIRFGFRVEINRNDSLSPEVRRRSIASHSERANPQPVPSLHLKDSSLPFRMTTSPLSPTSANNAEEATEGFDTYRPMSLAAVHMPSRDDSN